MVFHKFYETTKRKPPKHKGCRFAYFYFLLNFNGDPVNPQIQTVKTLGCVVVLDVVRVINGHRNSSLVVSCD